MIWKRKNRDTENFGTFFFKKETDQKMKLNRSIQKTNRREQSHERLKTSLKFL